MKKFGRRLFGISVLALSLMISVPASAEELATTEQPAEVVVEAEPETEEDVAMATNGWVKDSDGTYYYYVAGAMVKNQVRLINDKYYCFKENGAMLSLAEYGITNPSTGTTAYYRARKDGSLYSGEWYGSIYYNVGGNRASGPTKVNGRLYLFSTSGTLRTSGQATIDGVLYECNSTGVLTEYKDTRWLFVDGRWQYRQDGELLKSVVAEIGGKLYGFNSSGYMYSGYEFYLNSKYYLAKADGSLHTGWYYSEKGTSYYKEDGVKAKGTVTVDGKTYNFDSDGILYSQSGWSYGSVDDGNSVWGIRKSDGSIVEISGAGWHKIENKWYYIDKEQDLVRGCTKEINGKYYGFESSGCMVVDAAYDGWDGYFRAREDGTLYTNVWYNEAEDIYKNYNMNPNSNLAPLWRYYGADGNSNGGLVTIDGKNYLFDFNDHTLIQGEVYCYQKTAYKADRNGIGRKIGDGWHQEDDGTWIYILDGDYIEDGLQEIDGKTYFFDYWGKLIDDPGRKYLDGKYYLIKEGGEVALTPGWHKIKGNWYYLNEDGTVCSGLKEIDGYTYYFQPEMLCNKTYFYYEKVLYKVHGSTGKLTPVTTDGIYKTDERTYCVSDGKLFEGWKKENGYWYYYNPEMVVSDYIRNYKEDDLFYYFDAKGRLLANTWIKNPQYGSFAYLTSSGACATGTHVVDGVKYRFEWPGTVITHEADGNEVLDYTFYNTDGTFDEVTFKSGWNKFKGQYFYVTNGYLIDYQTMVIDGKLYYFNSVGAMVTNAKYNGYIFGKDGAAVSGWTQLGGHWYYCDPVTLKYVTGWHVVGKHKYYFEPSNSGFRQGIMCTTEKIIDGKKYIFNANGTVKKVEDKVYDGWVDVNGTPTYYKDGYAYTGWYGDYYLQDGVKTYNEIITYNKRLYCIDQNGKYLKSQWIPEKYAGSSRYEFDTYVTERKYFAKANGAFAMNEWVLIGGYWYYFDENSLRVTGMNKIDGVTYYFDSTGKMKGTYKTLTEGWNEVDDHWFYVQNGAIIMDGANYIKGKWYYFAKGVMVQNGFSTKKYDDYYIRYDQNYNHYYDKNGVRATYTGWKKIDGYWYYFDIDNRQTRGWMVLSGKTYYLNPEMLTGYHFIDGCVCYFNENGVLQSRKLLQTGWNKSGNKWYYNQGLVSHYTDTYSAYNEMVLIGDDYYYFSGYEMVANKVVKHNKKYYFFGADGKLVKKAGIYKDALGRSVYVTSDGLAHIGDVYINGVLKFMDAMCDTKGYY